MNILWAVKISSHSWYGFEAQILIVNGFVTQIPASYILKTCPSPFMWKQSIRGDKNHIALLHPHVESLTPERPLSSSEVQGAGDVLMS